MAYFTFKAKQCFYLKLSWGTYLLVYIQNYIQTMEPHFTYKYVKNCDYSSSSSSVYDEESNYQIKTIL